MSPLVYNSFIKPWPFLMMKLISVLLMFLFTSNAYAVKSPIDWRTPDLDQTQLVSILKAIALEKNGNDQRAIQKINSLGLVSAAADGINQSVLVVGFFASGKREIVEAASELLSKSQKLMPSAVEIIRYLHRIEMPYLENSVKRLSEKQLLNQSDEGGSILGGETLYQAYLRNIRVLLPLYHPNLCVRLWNYLWWVKAPMTREDRF